jgi:hypothetical protein
MHPSWRKADLFDVRLVKLNNHDSAVSLGPAKPRMHNSNVPMTIDSLRLLNNFFIAFPLSN